MMTGATNLFVAFTLWVFLLLPAHPACGQETGDAAWQFKGFIDTYHAFRSGKPHDWLSSRTRFRGEVGKSFGGTSLFVSFNATYNALRGERAGIDLREMYLDHRGEHWGFRLGRQLVIWGAADGVRVTDLVSPMDMTEFLAQDYDDIRMPVDALRFFVFSDKIKLELLLVPAFEGYKFSTDASDPWSVLSRESPFPLVWNEEECRPVPSLASVEYGGRLCFTLPGIDFSLAALHAWNKMPVFEYESSPPRLVVSPRHYRLDFFGGDLSIPLGQFVLRGEAAFNIGKHFTYKPRVGAVARKGFNTLNHLVGIDWYAPRDWTLMVQFSSETIFGHGNYIAQPRHASLLTCNLSKKMIGGILRFSDFTYFDINHRGWFSRFTVDYALNDHLTLSTGYDWLGGSGGVFALYKDNSAVRVQVRCNF